MWRPRKRRPVEQRHERDNLGFCIICGEPGERFTAGQPDFLCQTHMLLGLRDPAEFERVLREADRRS